MKTLLQKLSILVLILILVGCNDKKKHFMPNQEVLESFNKSYPKASNVWWRLYDNYDIANFKTDSMKQIAWYQNNGTEVLGEKELTMATLPIEVKDAFHSSVYIGSKVSWVKEVNMLGVETQYAIGASKAGVDNTLYYNANGLFLKKETGNSSTILPQLIPTKVDEYIMDTYPDAKIMDIDITFNTVSTFILNGEKRIHLHFDNSYNLMYTASEIFIMLVPQVVMNAVQEQYDSYTIEDVLELKYTNGSINYQFELLSQANQLITAIYNSVGDKVS